MAEPARATDVPELEAQIWPLRWHGFLLRFLIWAAAALYLARAAALLLGWTYPGADVRGAVYAALPAMIALDALLALSCVAAAIVLVCARAALKRRRDRGPRLLRAGFALSLAGTLAYALGRRLFAGLSPLSPALIARAAAAYALIWINASYYRKRRALFAPAEGGRI